MDRNKPDDAWFRDDRAEATELFEATTGSPSRPGARRPTTSTSLRVIVP